MVPRLFCEIAAGELESRSRQFPSARWLTWSPELLDVLRRHAHTARRLRPRLVTLSERKAYSYTYTVSLREHRALAADLRPLIQDVLRFDPGDSLYLFTGMSCPEAAWNLHLVFALLREAIRSATCDEWSAFYAPLSYVGGDARDFPLHADLYRPNVLFNVFEQVPADGSGRTVLLPIGEFFDTIASGGIPEGARARMTQLISGPLVEDGYTEFYDLLHGQRHSWTSALGERLASRQRLIHLGAYEGYLLHDRRWLHGRETPTGGVPRNRLRRLIYQPAAR